VLAGKERKSLQAGQGSAGVLWEDAVRVLGERDVMIKCNMGSRHPVGLLSKSDGGYFMVWTTTGCSRLRGQHASSITGARRYQWAASSPVDLVPSNSQFETTNPSICIVLDFHFQVRQPFSRFQGSVSADGKIIQKSIS